VARATHAGHAEVGGAEKIMEKVLLGVLLGVDAAREGVYTFALYRSQNGNSG